MQQERPLRVSQSEMAVFYRRLAMLLQAGIPIDQALLFLAQSSEGVLVEVASTLHGELIRGKSLTSAVSQPHFRRVFTPLAIGLINTGYQTGALVKCLDKQADITEKQLRLRNAFVSALIYPAALTACIIAVAAIFLVFVASDDAGLFATTGREAPMVTRLLVGASGVLRTPLLWVTGVALVVIIGPLLRRAWSAETRFRKVIDAGLLGMPLIGPIVVKATSAKILYIWSSGLSVGLSLDAVINLSLPVISNTVIREKLNQAISLFRNGMDFGDSLKQCDVFPILVTSMVSVALEAGDMDRTLQSVSTVYEEEVEVAFDQLSSVLEPFLLTCAGVMAGVVALACLSPMLEFTQQI